MDPFWVGWLVFVVGLSVGASDLGLLAAGDWAEVTVRVGDWVKADGWPDVWAGAWTEGWAAGARFGAWAEGWVDCGSECWAVVWGPGVEDWATGMAECWE